MPDPRHSLGKRGEQIAAEYLQTHGFFIRERNWKTRVGKKWWEIDIIAEERRGIWPFRRTKRIVFVEVKTTRLSGHFRNVQNNVQNNVQKKEIGHSPFHPEMQVDARRQKRLIRGAEMYLTKNGISPLSDWQIDVIGVMVDPQTNEMTLRRTERAVGDVLL